jgi:hypothetical protein
MPVPESKIRISVPIRISTQDVLPPKVVVRGPGVAIEPRVPQNVTRACWLAREARQRSTMAYSSSTLNGFTR